jgi:hypothetical protein
VFILLIFASNSFFHSKKTGRIRVWEKFCVCECVCVSERGKPYSWVIGGQLFDHRGPMIDNPSMPLGLFGNWTPERNFFRK